MDVQITLSTVFKEFHCLVATKVRTHLKFGELGKVGMATAIRMLPRAPMLKHNQSALTIYALTWRVTKETRMGAKDVDQDQENALEQGQDGPVN